MATPLRRRLAAAVTCVALLFGTFGYMQRTAAETPIPNPAECRDDGDRPAVIEEHRTPKDLGFLCLFGSDKA